jgi:hypothetical protein
MRIRNTVMVKHFWFWICLAADGPDVSTMWFNQLSDHSAIVSSVAEAILTAGR